MSLQVQIWESLSPLAKDFVVYFLDSLGKPKDSAEAATALEAAKRLDSSDRQLVAAYIMTAGLRRYIQRLLVAERHNRLMTSVEVRQLSKIKPLRTQGTVTLHVCFGAGCPICELGK